MSSFALKVIAIIAMSFDHFGYVIYGHSSWMNYIGRLAFPIFAWQIATGFLHTKDIKVYLYRLFILALISQPFYIMFLSTITTRMQLNVVFTLILGLICLVFLKKDERLGILISIIACIVAEYFKFEYGSYGIIMIVIFYLFRGNEKMVVLMEIANLLIYYIGSQSKLQLFSIFGVLIVLLYNEEQGKKVKYMFYIFYPLHLFVLYLLNTG